MMPFRSASRQGLAAPPRPSAEREGHSHGPARYGAAPAYAALDLGTNNCRLLIGAPLGTGFRVVDSFSRIVRLGEGLAATGQLSEIAMERALGALAACADKLLRRPLRSVQAVATEACRRATNGAAFLHRVEVETGLRPRIISAREEAELAMESCAPLLEAGDRRALLFDIGGGSTEIAWIRIPAGGRRSPSLSATSRSRSVSLPLPSAPDIPASPKKASARWSRRWRRSSRPSTGCTASARRSGPAGSG
ncbi:Ppx/GppA phosphatase family protein [Siccirubricoccus deserti]